MTITEFLLARIAEDEAVAWSIEQRPWLAFTAKKGGAYVHGVTTDLDTDYEPDVFVGSTQAAAVHIARHDPARVLAECEAKRRIVELHSRFPVGAPPYDPACSDPPTRMVNVSECGTLRALAAVYADHPDYDQAWSL